MAARGSIAESKDCRGRPALTFVVAQCRLTQVKETLPMGGNVPIMFARVSKTAMFSPIKKALWSANFRETCGRRDFSKAARLFGHFAVFLYALAFGSISEAQVPPFLTQKDLLTACRNDAPSPQAFCLGYIEGAAHFWKTWTVCASETEVAISRCAGTRSAEAEISRFIFECDDCDYSTFRDRMREYVVDLRGQVSECTRDPEKEPEFCKAYDLHLESEIATLEYLFVPDLDRGWRHYGLGLGSNEIALHGFIDEFHQVFPCLPFDAGPEQIKAALLEYVKKNAEENLNDRTPTAIMLLAKAAFTEICPGPGYLPHIESCVKWQEFDGLWGGKNLCAEDIDIQFFLVSKGQTSGAILAPGDVFLTGFDKDQVDADDWMYTACPSGYQSTASFFDHEIKVRRSQYYCRLK